MNAIAQNVLDQLGTPENLDRVQVNEVGEHTYRVNIRTTVTLKADSCFVKSSLITSSFFINTDDNGTILRSSPPIQRKYR